MYPVYPAYPWFAVVVSVVVAAAVGTLPDHVVE
jgi:hypothetical protein